MPVLVKPLVVIKNFNFVNTTLMCQVKKVHIKIYFISEYYN